MDRTYQAPSWQIGDLVIWGSDVNELKAALNGHGGLPATIIAGNARTVDILVTRPDLVWVEHHRAVRYWEDPDARDAATQGGVWMHNPRLTELWDLRGKVSRMEAQIKELIKAVNDLRKG